MGRPVEIWKTLVPGAQHRLLTPETPVPRAQHPLAALKTWCLDLCSHQKTPIPRAQQPPLTLNKCSTWKAEAEASTPRCFFLPNQHGHLPGREDPLAASH